MDVLVITTGGTMGALPVEDITKPPYFTPMPTDRDYVCDALEQHFHAMKARCVTLEQRDSKNIDDAYLQNLLTRVMDADEGRVILTHGTDRLLQTAGFFYNQVSGKDHPLNSKVLILTGAMVPLANGPESDGYQNLEYCLRLTTEGEIGPGIYMVLSDYADQQAEAGAWVPRLYAYEPGAYEKVYSPDARYNRLRRT